MVNGGQRRGPAQGHSRGAELRACAATAVHAVAHCGRSLDAALSGVRGRIAESERSALQEMTYGSIRWYDRLRVTPESWMRRTLRRRDLDVLSLTVVGMYQLQHMRIAPHAAVSETVAACAIMGKSWATGLVNHLLRRALREGPLPDPMLSDAQRLSMPDWLLEHVRNAWPVCWERVIDASNARPPMVLRVNRRRITRTAYLQRLQDAGLNALPCAVSTDGIQLESSVAPSRLPGFDEGFASVQDESAQLVARALAPCSGERILDACAAPGGKTAHILELANGPAEVTAVDLPERVGLLRDTLARLGLVARIVAADVTAPQSWWDGRCYDRVLVDAPCSGTGVLRRHPDIKHLRRPEDLESYTSRQLRLLNRVWPLLRPGGHLLYVTCSILPVENEEVARRFLADHPTAQEHPLGKEFGLPRNPGRQRLPGLAQGDGFFYVCFEKGAGAD